MPFEFQTTDISGLFSISPKVFPDNRGFFMESWKYTEFSSIGITETFVQDNHSFSSKGVLRGLHFQRDPEAQGKLVRVVTGAVWDVAVDLRPDSVSFGKWFAAELNETNKKMLYIPPGFAHGFLTLSNNTHFLYKCTHEYSPDYDSGIRWDDSDLAIAWPLNDGTVPEISPKDQLLPTFKETFS